MMRAIPRFTAAGLLAVIATTACTNAGSAPLRTTPAPIGGSTVGARNTVTPDGRYPFTPADVNFMARMIPHHAQAVQMAKWAPTHNAGASLRLLCERIVVGQTDEIGLMQNWLKDRGQAVPPANAMRMHMVMNGQEHDMLMPGMLTDEEMAALDKARGSEWDRLFLLGMIKHHEGAIQMVNELNAAPGAAQDEIVFKFSNDVYIDQTTEIERMHKMLTPLQGKP